MVHLFADFYEKQYKVSCFSCIAFVWFFFFAFSIILPFLEAHRAGGKHIIILTNLSHVQAFGYDSRLTLSTRQQSLMANWRSH